MTDNFKGDVTFGLSLDPSSMEWAAWNNTIRGSQAPDFVASTSEGLVRQIKAAYPGREYKEHGSFFIIDPIVITKP